MAMQLLETPNYIKKKELKEGKFAFENYSYVSSGENNRSQYPGTPGAINHTFQDEKGKKFIISGDTVMNRIVEDEFIVGMPCGLFYHGKKDADGNEVKYHNWSPAIDLELQKELRAPAAKKIDDSGMDDLA